jgi:hypothetical protein
MPYIKQEERVGRVTYAETAGQLNYVFTQVITEYLDNNGKSYQTINDIVGALECCKLELYRRIVAPYEDTKIKENGDVY